MNQFTRFLSALLMLAMLAGCGVTEDTSPPSAPAETTDFSYLGITAPEIAAQYDGMNLQELTESETISIAPRVQHTEPYTFTLNGEAVTVNLPLFTGLMTNEVSTYKETFDFEDGAVVFRTRTESEERFLRVDKAGRLLDGSYPYPSLPDVDWLHDPGLYTTHEAGRVIGRNLVVAQEGEPGSYTQYLCGLDGKRLSDGYDSIGYFYNGIAAVTKDFKLGFIDEAGNQLLEPCIEFDAVTYPPTERYFLPIAMWEDALILPIGGEIAIITLTRGGR